ncbi:MAG: NTP transferase domain-containing protein [Antricoccus sp.]
MTDSVRAIVLAGGTAQRLGGVHKPSLRVGGIPIIARLCAALRSFEPIVVGLAQDVPAEVEITREDPPGGGPVAAIAVGLDALSRADVVLVIAGDLPFFDAQSADLLVSNLGSFDGCLYADGQTHWLAGCWQARALRARIAAVNPRGMSVRSLAAALRTTTVRPLNAAAVFDVDTREDLEQANAIVAGRSRPLRE